MLRYADRIFHIIDGKIVKIEDTRFHSTIDLSSSQNEVDAH